MPFIKLAGIKFNMIISSFVSSIIFSEHEFKKTFFLDMLQKLNHFMGSELEFSPKRIRSIRT